MRSGAYKKLCLGEVGQSNVAFYFLVAESRVHCASGLLSDKIRQNVLLCAGKDHKVRSLRIVRVSCASLVICRGQAIHLRANRSQGENSDGMSIQCRGRWKRQLLQCTPCSTQRRDRQRAPLVNMMTKHNIRVHGQNGHSIFSITQLRCLIGFQVCYRDQRRGQRSRIHDQ